MHYSHFTYDESTIGAFKSMIGNLKLNLSLKFRIKLFKLFTSFSVTESLSKFPWSQYETLRADNKNGTTRLIKTLISIFH